MTLYLFKFNNYYNRIVKRYDTVQEYINNGTWLNEDLKNFMLINFISNDGINASQIINYEGDMPDYLLVVNTKNEIVSRWFVVSHVKLRESQYRLELYRDTIADYYDDAINSPCFIEKATVNIGNPLIFNGENFAVNQIKKQEYLLKDSTGCPWIVGYLARDSGKIETTFEADITADETIAGISTWDWYEYSNYGSKKLYSNITSVCYNVYAKASYKDDDDDDYLARFSIGNIPDTPYETIRTDSITNAYAYWTEQAKDTSYNLTKEPNSNVAIFYMNNIYNTEYKTKTNEYLLKIINNNNLVADLNAPFEWNGKTIYDSLTGKTYKVNVKYKTDSDNKVNIGSAEFLFGSLKEIVLKATNAYQVNGSLPNAMGAPNGSSFSATYDAQQCFIELELIQNGGYKAMLFGDDYPRPTLKDAPYDMFCMPYSDELVIHHSSELEDIVCNKSIELNCATSLVASSGGQIWDLQLVPYCPFQGIARDGELDATKVRHSLIYKTQTGQQDTPVGIILYCINSKFEFNIPFVIERPENAIESKVQQECDLWRLCSPNMDGIFEFSPVRNEGVEWINVDCHYKPFQPYIHLNPNFHENSLYGKDWNDPRGLICGGDFSLPMLNDAWAQYELQNKNYQRQFDRQIQSMDIHHKYARMSENIGIGVGGLQAGATAAAIGSVMGPVGIAAGFALGSGFSLLGGAKDYQINEALRKEERSSTIDQFGYQLDNIKALPESISKVSAFNNNNKIFPFIEFYTCTNTEKEALRNKLRYNGMNVGVIGTIKDYQQVEKSFIKGSLIRIPELKNDFRAAMIVAEEISKGVFI